MSGNSKPTFIFHQVEPENKPELLVDLITQQHAIYNCINPSHSKFLRMVVLVENSSDASKLALFLCKKGFKAGFVHFGNTDSEIEATHGKIRKGEINVIIGTEILCMTKIEELKMVVLYDMPKDYKSLSIRFGMDGELKANIITCFLDKEADDEISKLIIEKAQKVKVNDKHFWKNFWQEQQ